MKETLHLGQLVQLPELLQVGLEITVFPSLYLRQLLFY